MSRSYCTSEFRLDCFTGESSREVEGLSYLYINTVVFTIVCVVIHLMRRKLSF